METVPCTAMDKLGFTEWIYLFKGWEVWVQVEIWIVRLCWYSCGLF
jgi:hypothetical protein